MPAYTSVPAAPLDPLLELVAVDKVFHDRRSPSRVLHPISLAIQAGEVVALVGPSGSGKSTLLRIIADLIAATSGEVRIGGLPPDEARKRRYVGLMFQAGVLLPWRTASGNVRLPLEISDLPRREADEAVAAALRQVGLFEFSEHMPRQLSGGMQQRVALARALVCQPRLLLLDEPFGALDELGREEMNLELLRIKGDSGLTVLVVTHNVDEAVFLADRVLVLGARPGRLVAEIQVSLSAPRRAAQRREQAYVEATEAVREALRAVSQSGGLGPEAPSAPD